MMMTIKAIPNPINTRPIHRKIFLPLGGADVALDGGVADPSDSILHLVLA
jgi:hypothetical protein